MTALLLGKTLVGMRAFDVARGADVVARRMEVDGGSIYVHGKGAGALPALYAALVDQRIRRVVLEGLLLSYESVTSQRLHREVFEQIVPGILKHTDIPDLVAALAPRPVAVLSTADPLGRIERRPGEPAAADFFTRP